jgi:hypothetical protein
LEIEMTRRDVFGLFMGPAILCAAGCGGSAGKPGDVAGPAGKDALADLKTLLEEVKQTNKRPPASRAELMVHEATNPAAVSGILRGLVVYSYGQGLIGGPAVIAYETAADKNGGWVLFQDGTLKEMSAADFASAPKAKK